MWSGKFIEAAEAERIGLVSKMVPHYARTHARTHARARERTQTLGYRNEKLMAGAVGVARAMAAGHYIGHNHMGRNTTTSIPKLALLGL